MIRKTLLSLALLAAFGAGTAWAATPSKPAPSAPAAHAALDRNGDGAVDRSEAAQAPRLAENFDRLDRDRNGTLAGDELRKGHRRGQAPQRHGLMALDADHDGRVSQAEVKAGEGKLSERFAQMDANKDGYVDRADHEARRKAQRDAWFAQADRDKDGKLSRAEFDAARPERPMHERGHGRHGAGERPPVPPAAS